MEGERNLKEFGRTIYTNKMTIYKNVHWLLLMNVGEYTGILIVIGLWIMTKNQNKYTKTLQIKFKSIRRNNGCSAIHRIHYISFFEWESSHMKNQCEKWNTENRFNFKNPAHNWNYQAFFHLEHRHIQ